MSISPSFSFFIPGEKGSIFPGSPLWQLPLSGNSSGFSKNIQVTDAVHDILRDEFALEPRGEIEIKGKGLMRTWWLGSAK